jgi:ATP-dependent DNA helicase RecG
MDLAELHQLVAAGESERLEFKKATGELHGGMETLCGLLNGRGGKVLFGVTNSGRIVGQDISDATLQEVAAAIRKIEPHAWIDQTRIPLAEGREVLMLETTLQTDTLYVFDGRPYQRIGPTATLRTCLPTVG